MKHLLEFGLYRVDPEERVLLRGSEPIPLSPKAFDLLLLLMERSGQVVPKDDLMRLLWPDTFVEESNLGQHVFQLRKALGERAQGSSYIVTVPGRGYRFAQSVRAMPDDAIVVQSHSRVRLEIEEKVDGSTIDPDSRVIVLPEREFKALPPHLALKWYRGPIAALLFLGAALGALAVWIFIRPVPMPKVVATVKITHFGRVEPLGQTLTDGSRIFFTERMGGTGRLASVSEQGGEPALVPTSMGSLTLCDIDRSRGRLLVLAQNVNPQSNYPLWILPTAGGSGRRVGDVDASYAAWSPDGQWIAFTNTTGLHVVSDDGSQLRWTFSTPGVAEYPRWSHDGQRLSFSVRSFSTATLSLWEIGSDGSNPHSVAFGWKDPTATFGEGECCGDWSPDDRYFMFRSHRDGVESVWIYRPKNGRFSFGGTNLVELYTSPDRINEPRFSADGRKILFANNQERRELVRFDDAKKMFVPYLGGIPARHLSFSRDGQWVAYKNEADKTLWRARVDGTEAVQLTFVPLDTYHPTWSPDGKKVAFQGDGKLYVVPFEGGIAEPISPPDMRDTQPSWSPDGRSIVFTRWTGEDDSSIGFLDMTTRQIQMLPNTDRFEGPRWSPDGKYIAAGSRNDRKLMLFDVSRRQWSGLADGTPYGWGIRWSSDSKYVYYQRAYLGEEQPIFRVRISDRKVERVTSSREILRADVMSYIMTGLTPDNSPVASLLHTNSDVNALELDLP
jgi:Tol biopolymer transport system component/DNA-binding winged helix-turn-helix (wHTH) protein